MDMLTLALALALLAQTESAPPGNEQVRYSIKLPNLEGVKPGDDKGQQLKIASFRWGAAGAGGDSKISAPLPQGNAVVKTEWPWTACQVGASYPSLSLIGGGKHNLLEQVTVSNCGGAWGTPSEGIVFDYAKVTVSGWDPKKKEIIAAEASPR